MHNQCPFSIWPPELYTLASIYRTLDSFCPVKLSSGRLEASHLHGESDSGLADEANPHAPLPHLKHKVGSPASSYNSSPTRNEQMYYRQFGRSKKLHAKYKNMNGTLVLTPS